MSPMSISVVIPTLNEQQQIGGAIRSVAAAGAGEVIVSDGGSGDATESVARAAGATKWVRSLPGRGTQLNAGASVADHRWLLFLHADSRLTPGCLEPVVSAQGSPWGAFRQRIDSPRRIYRWIERGNAARVRRLGMAFGDQAIFVDRDLFRKVGGFPDIGLMEDVALSRRLRRIARPRLLPGPVVISPRRWERRGVVRQTVRNWSIQVAFRFGVSPETLRTWYER